MAQAVKETFGDGLAAYTTAMGYTVEEKNLIKVGFTGNDASGEPANAGFMKVDLSVAE